MEPALNRREDSHHARPPLPPIPRFNGARPQQAGGPYCLSGLLTAGFTLQWSPPSTGGRTLGARLARTRKARFNGARPQQAGGRMPEGTAAQLPAASMEPALNRREDGRGHADPCGGRAGFNGARPQQAGGHDGQAQQLPGGAASMEPALNRREDSCARVGGTRAGVASMEPALNRREDSGRAEGARRLRCFNGARPQQAGGRRRACGSGKHVSLLQWSPPSTGGRTALAWEACLSEGVASMEPALNRREDWTC